LPPACRGRRFGIKGGIPIPEATPRVVEVETPADLEAVRLLLMSHAAALRGHLGAGALLSDAMKLPGPYVPVLGRLYLARLNGAAAGCVGLCPLGETVGEVKRLYVVPAARRRGVARALMERLLADARAIGYDRIRLGTLEEMTAARALYRALGFMEIPRYREEELVDTVFFECHLADRRSCFASAPHSGEEP
jgi:ribosomal protein S18 acetylase RimI-like enzyme